MTFNSNHFALWGRAATTDRSLIKDIVTRYPADLMLMALGFNDLGWFYNGHSGTLESVYSIIQQSRAVNPNVCRKY